MLKDRVIDKTTPVPLYFQLKTILLEEIKAGSFSEDNMIPTEIEIGEMFDISRTTVRQAITELVQEGYLYRVKSKGTFVSKPKVAFKLLSNVYDSDIRDSGRDLTIKVLGQKEVRIPDDLFELKRDTNGNKAVYLERVRITDGVPISVTKTYMRGDLFQRFLEVDMAVHSVHEIMETSKETKVARMVRTVEAINCDAEFSDKLEVEEGEAIQKITSRRYNYEGKMLDISYGYYRGDMNAIEFEIQNPPS